MRYRLAQAIQAASCSERLHCSSIRDQKPHLRSPRYALLLFKSKSPLLMTSCLSCEGDTEHRALRFLQKLRRHAHVLCRGFGRSYSRSTGGTLLVLPSARAPWDVFSSLLGMDVPRRYVCTVFAIGTGALVNIHGFQKTSEGVQCSCTSMSKRH